MYLNLLKKHVIDNKYTRWYIEIINNSKNRTTTGYIEKHHILPKSFKLGGEKDSENIASLTAREHFVCHRLLVKMVSDKKQKMKMQKAVWLLYKNISRKTSRSYEEVRIYFESVNRESTKTLWQTPEYREKQAKAAETKYKKEGYSDKRSALTKKQMEDPDQREKARNTLRKVHENIDHSSEEWVSRSFRSPDSISKSIASSKTPEAREKAKQRELSKGAEILSEGGKNRNRKAVENGILKYGSEEAFRRHHAKMIRGRKKYINTTTNENRMFKPDSVPVGFELITKQHQ